MNWFLNATCVRPCPVPFPACLVLVHIPHPCSTSLYLYRPLTGGRPKQCFVVILCCFVFRFYRFLFVSIKVSKQKLIKKQNKQQKTLFSSTPAWPFVLVPAPIPLSLVPGSCPCSTRPCHPCYSCSCSVLSLESVIASCSTDSIMVLREKAKWRNKINKAKQRKRRSGKVRRQTSVGKRDGDEAGWSTNTGSKR